MATHVMQRGLAMDLSGGEIAGLVIGPAGLLATIGGAIKWVNSTWAAREKYVDARMQAYVSNLEGEMKAIREASRAREERIGRLEVVTNLLLVEVAGLDPQSKALLRARQLLNISYPLPNDPPDNIADLMDEMHHREGKP